MNYNNLIVFLTIIVTVNNFFAQESKKPIIYITPGTHGNNFLSASDEKKDCHVYTIKKTLEAIGYEVKPAIDLSKLEIFSYLICFDIPTDHIKYLQNFDKSKCILFLWEPYVVKPDNYNKDNHLWFSSIYTWYDDLVDNVTYHKFYYPVLKKQTNNTLFNFAQKKFCVLINSNKSIKAPDDRYELYMERINLIRFFEKNTYDFDLYGHKWEKFNFKNYRGPVNDKIKTLSQYKFCICYENNSWMNGYVTEKIFDCFCAGCVPIYWGAPNITKYIPETCFIDRRKFGSNEELMDFLTNMTERHYEGYLENIKKFLTSDAAQLYSVTTFIKIFFLAIDLM